MKPISKPRHWLSSVVLLVVVLCCGAVRAGELYLFGDSLTDSGNNLIASHADPNQFVAGNYYIPTYPYASGVYSNGDVWAIRVAWKLKQYEAAVPSLLGGGDFAFGGARVSRDTEVPSAMTQVRMFLDRRVRVRPDDLFVIAIGGNDLRDALTGVSGDPVTAAQNFAAAVGALIDTLQAQGARHFLVWNVPNLGLAPAIRFQDAVYPDLHVAASATQISILFNNYLTARLASEHGVSVFDLFGTMGDFIAHKEKYGFTNVTDAAGAVPGANADTYLFWDGIHPTAAGHAAVARAILAVWPDLRERECCDEPGGRCRDEQNDHDHDRDHHGDHGRRD